MAFVRYLVRFSDQLSKFLMIAAAVWAMGLSVLIVGDILGNNVFGNAIPGVREIVISSIVMIVYLYAAAYVAAGLTYWTAKALGL